MMQRRSGAAISQRIRLGWLELTAQLVVQGLPRREIEERLQDELQDSLSVGARPVRGSRDKAISVLLRTWVAPTDELLPLRDDGLRLLQRLPREEHLPLHWGMLMCVYPVFGTVAEIVGRLVRIQGAVGSMQVQRLLREQLGDRESVVKAAQATLRTFVDWHVLVETSTPRLFASGVTLEIADAGLRGWLVEAALRWSATQVAPLQTLTQTPAFFPFSIRSTSLREVDALPRLDWFRQGLDEDMVTLRPIPSSSCQATPLASR